MTEGHPDGHPDGHPHWHPDGNQDWQRQEWVDLMLDECETWAVIGLRDPRRTAYSIAELLQRRGKRIVPIHPALGPGGEKVLGEPGYAALADVPFPVEVVDVFRRSSAAGEFADQAVSVGARGVWLQLGVVDEGAFGRTIAAGVPMVMDTCPAIEWRRR
jgi:predicted CoA-binding protein